MLPALVLFRPYVDGTCKGAVHLLASGRLIPLVWNAIASLAFFMPIRDAIFQTHPKGIMESRRVPNQNALHTDYTCRPNGSRRNRYDRIQRRGANLYSIERISSNLVFTHSNYPALRAVSVCFANWGSPLFQQYTTINIQGATINDYVKLRSFLIIIGRPFSSKRVNFENLESTPCNIESTLRAASVRSADPMALYCNHTTQDITICGAAFKSLRLRHHFPVTFFIAASRPRFKRVDFENLDATLNLGNTLRAVSVRSTDRTALYCNYTTQDIMIRGAASKILQLIKHFSYFFIAGCRPLSFVSNHIKDHFSITKESGCYKVRHHWLSKQQANDRLDFWAAETIAPRPFILFQAQLEPQKIKRATRRMNRGCFLLPPAGARRTTRIRQVISNQPTTNNLPSGAIYARQELHRPQGCESTGKVATLTSDGSGAIVTNLSIPQVARNYGCPKF